MRFERKYVVEHLSVAEICQFIKLHPASFREAFPPRQINNIYFDTANYAACQDNLKGIGLRKKIRLRWYNQNSFANTDLQLEEKIKETDLGYKIIHQLPKANLQGQLSDILPVWLTESHQLIPTLFNQYNRRYYISANQKFRITIDTHLAFGTPNPSPSQQSQYHLPNRIIVELKYEESAAEFQDQITQYLPFRLSKNSKYIIGVTLITT